MFAAAALSLVAGPAKADPAEIQIVTQSFAPLQWDNAGKPDGYVTAYMLEVARRVGETIPLKIGAYEFLPWKRGNAPGRNHAECAFLLAVANAGAGR